MPLTVYISIYYGGMALTGFCLVQVWRNGLRRWQRSSIWLLGATGVFVGVLVIGVVAVPRSAFGLYLTWYSVAPPWLVWLLDLT